MIKAYIVDGDRLRQVEGVSQDDAGIVWVDLLEPTREEETQIEAWLGVGVPTREEMQEIEISSRLYVEDGVYFMTAIIAANTDTDHPVMAPATFVLAGNRLVTIRYHRPRAFDMFPARAEKAQTGCTNGETVMIGLLETIVDRLADVLERVSGDIEVLSTQIFNPKEKKASQRDRDFQRLLKALGGKESLASNMRYSLTSLQRVSGFLFNISDKVAGHKEAKSRLKTLSRDVVSLADHANFLSNKITFLLDATLGMINIEQNGIIKIVSVAAVVFLPPTLVASIYGMNFQHMPELGWSIGYPLAIGLMVVSAVLPFLYFRNRGWL